MSSEEDDLAMPGNGSNGTTSKTLLPTDIGTDFTFQRQIVWPNVIFFGLLHVAFVYAISVVPQAMILTQIYGYFIYLFNCEGIVAGAHRCFSHKAYKLRQPSKTILLIAQTMAGQNSVITWARDHRLHHKYSDTDADPHNATRGLFFSHIGWLLSRKHPMVKEKGRTIDITDLTNDPLLAFQHKYYIPLYFFWAIFVPTIIPWFFWGESYRISFFLCYVLRYVIQLHVTWLTNSAAHYSGMKPYDKNIKPAECLWAFPLGGEEYHNYHHTFPSDYRASEHSLSYSFTTWIIDILASIGQAYDLKTTSHDLMQKRLQRCGDGTHVFIPTNAQKQANFTLSTQRNSRRNTALKG